MTGSRRDIASRMRAVLPTKWFGDITPILDTLLNGFGAGWEYIYQFQLYARQQTRLSTASALWLDLVALDFFGSRISRSAGQSDNALSVCPGTSLAEIRIRVLPDGTHL